MMTKTVAKRIEHDADAVDAALSRIDVELETARSWSRSIRAEAQHLAPLPAPALTEQAIVDALKADPGMAGRVIVQMCYENNGHDRGEIGRAAYNRVTSLYSGGSSPSLQSLAVALAAASYRG
jgi:hypothetical protein